MNVLSPTGAFTTASRNVVAAGHLVGGDVHAVRHTPHGIRLLIGDVRGKGPCAAVGAAALLAAFEAAADHSPTLPDLVTALESALLRDARCESVDAPEHFATAVVAQISPDGRTLRLLNRGHPAPLMLRPGGVFPLEPGRRNLPLGLRELDSTAPDAVDMAAFPEGATLLMFTDGVTEARDARDTFYEPAVRLARHGAVAPEELLDLLHHDVRRHTGGRAVDDMALLAVRRAPRVRYAVGRKDARPRPRRALSSP